MIQIRSAFWKR